MALYRLGSCTLGIIVELLESEINERTPSNRKCNPTCIVPKTNDNTMLKCLQVLGWFLANLPATKRLRGHRQALNSLVQLPDGNLASSSDDHT